MSFTGLGMFCGPFMDLAATWSTKVPGGLLLLTAVTIAIGVVLFTYIEEMSQVDAAYMSFITGTTIGYVCHVKVLLRTFSSDVSGAVITDSLIRFTMQQVWRHYSIK